MVLQTTGDLTIDDLVKKGVPEGDIAVNANTIILLGRHRTGRTMGRAAFVLKHRGRACSEEIVPFRITDRGLAAAD